MARNEGFKYWSDQEFVQGFDTNAYLMSQSVMRFDNSADRDSALARTLTSGMLAYDKSTTTLQLYDGSSWVDVAVGTVGVTDHGALTGLGDDDHSQYHTDARGDARYLQLTGGSLSGDLQFSLNAGNSNIEWTGATGPMGLEISPSGTFESALYYRTTPLAWSFENASGDDILCIDINDGRVGIGTDSPAAELDIRGASNPEIRLQSTDGTDPAFYFGDQTDAVRGGFYFDISENALLFRGYNNNTRMTIDSSGRVGIGITPDAILHVYGGTSDTNIRVTSSDAGAYIGFDDSTTTLDWWRQRVGVQGNSLVLQTNGNTRMLIDSNGNVGINDNTPSYKLDVNGTARFTGDVITSDLTVNCADTEMTVQGSLAGIQFLTRNTGNRYVIYNSSGILRFWEGSDKMTLNSSGNLSVTGSITYGTLIQGNTAQSRDKIRVWNSSYYTIGMRSGYNYGHLVSDYAMSFQMNNSSTRGFWWGDDQHTQNQGAMSLTTNGRLTVATSISVGEGESTTIPDANTLKVNGKAVISTVQVGGTAGPQLTYDSTSVSKLNINDPIQFDHYIGTTLTSSSNNDYFTMSDSSYNGYGGSYSFKHDTSKSTGPPGNSAVTAGRFFASNTSVGSTSDRRLKKNIEDFDNEIGLEILRRLRPRTFEWDYDDITGLWAHGTQIGLVAQEVDEVFPAWVDYWPQEDARRKSDGEIVERALSLGLDQQFQVMVVSAIQNIADRLETLETA